MADVLGTGAHPDDLELGTAGPGDTTQRDAEARAAAEVIGADVEFGHLPDGSVSNHELALVHVIEDAAQRHRIDITATLDKKISALTQHATQVDASPVASLGLVRTQAGYRGFQARVEAAEGFEPLRLVVEI